MLFPHIKCEILSRRTPEEISERLRSVTDISGIETPFFLIPLFGVSGNRPFMGKMDETNFWLIPRLGSVTILGMDMQLKNSFLPMIKGRIWREGKHTTVDIKMSLWLPVKLFLLVWFGLTGFCFLVGLLAIFTEGILFAILAGGMFLGGQLLVRAGFHVPANKALRQLKALMKM